MCDANCPSRSELSTRRTVLKGVLGLGAGLAVAATRAGAQEALRKVCHEVGRSGTGGRPWVFRIRAIVERPTRCPTFFSAP